MTVINQHALSPGETLRAIAGMFRPGALGLQVAVAYLTRPGCQLLLSRLATPSLRATYLAADKALVSSFDFGFTHPDGLRYLQAEGFTVQIAGRGTVRSRVLAPRPAFHSKVYTVRYGAHAESAVGSPNLTERALTTNTETLALSRLDIDEADELWAGLTAEALPLTDALLDEYSSLRRRLATPRSIGAEPAAVPPTEPDPPFDPDELSSVADPQTLLTFETAVNNGLDPLVFDHFWIEAGSMSSGGSHNQLELPRLSNRFFAGTFDTYASAHETIGHPVLLSRGTSWTDRPLTWHGNNRMERINLPTIAIGGYDYAHMAVLFTRTALGYELSVVPWDGVEAAAWRAASTSIDTVFRLGQASNRTCGLF